MHSTNPIFGIFCVTLLINGLFSGENDKNRCPFFNKRVEGQSFSDQNAADAACSPPSKQCDPNDIFYTMDGSCNNIRIPSWAQAGTAYVRLLPANYSDGISKLRRSVDGSPLPAPRNLRRELIPDETIQSKKLNILFYGFGQFVDHDVTLGRSMNTPDRCCINNKPATNMPEKTCLPLLVQKNDPFYSKFNVTCIEFKRITNTQSLGCNVKPSFPINSQTGVLDLSVTYGTSDSEVKTLRTGKGGLLKVSNDTQTSHQEYPLIVSGNECPTGGIDRRPGAKCFKAGDERINQNPELLVVDVIYVKLHNLIAKHLQSINPKWNDQRLFQETRRICIAMYQHVTMAEYVPILIGAKTASLYKLFPATSGYVNGYDSNLNPQTLTSYASAAGRAGHSNVVGFVEYLGPNNKMTSYRLRDKFFNHSFMLDKNMFVNILRTYIEKPGSRQDQFFTQEINNWMFHDFNEDFGFDLSAVDISRGRDFGLPSYNKFREACGLCRLEKFEDLMKEIRRPEDVQKLRTIYKSVNDIDYYIGGLLEKPLEDGTVGQSFACIQAESFFRWKFGDRLFYEFPQAKFTLAQLTSIRKTTMSQIICKTNLWMKTIPKNSFLLESPQNRLVNCKDLPDINLAPWKDK